jgi:predicted choloylglycine hydrolase
MNYYNSELKKVRFSKGIPNLKLTSEEGETKWFNLNLQSIPEVIEYLKELQSILEHKEDSNN